MILFICLGTQTNIVYVLKLMIRNMTLLISPRIYLYLVAQNYHIKLVTLLFYVFNVIVIVLSLSLAVPWVGL